MKKQPSAGAAARADFTSDNWTFLPRLTERNTADRWIKASEKLFLSLNGEENGTRSNQSAFLSSRMGASRMSGRRIERVEEGDMSSWQLFTCCLVVKKIMISWYCVLVFNYLE